MSRQIQFRRGTAAEHENFTGAIGEVTVDTTHNTLRVHDGRTPGGTPMARADTVTDMTGADYVVAWQMPTSENNYTWYRKYRSGWLEMGGRLSGRSVTFPIEFTSSPTIATSQTDTAQICAVTINIYDITTTGFSGHRAQIADTWHNWVLDMSGMWVAYGMSAE